MVRFAFAYVMSKASAHEVMILHTIVASNWKELRDRAAEHGVLAITKRGGASRDAKARPEAVRAAGTPPVARATGAHRRWRGVPRRTRRGQGPRPPTARAPRVGAPEAGRRSGVVRSL